MPDWAYGSIMRQMPFQGNYPLLHSRNTDRRARFAGLLKLCVI